MLRRTPPAALLCLLVVSLLGGCTLFSYIGGKGTQEALFKLPPGKRVLVFVDSRPPINPPPEFDVDLAQKISDYLYKHQATDKIVLQSRLTELRREPEKFAKLGIADIARATDADLVIYVDLVAYSIHSLSDNSINSGLAQALVKVVDKNGARLWPTIAITGMAIEAKSDPAFTEQRDETAVERELEELLTLRAGRMFHDYDLNDPAMTK